MIQDPDRNELRFQFEGKRAGTTQLGKPNENYKLCIQSNKCSVEFFTLNLELIFLCVEMPGGRHRYDWLGGGDLQEMLERKVVLLHLHDVT